MTYARPLSSSHIRVSHHVEAGSSFRKGGVVHAAVHYFECWLYQKYGEHTETTIPIKPDGKLEVTAHAWREKLIETRLSREAFESFRKLRNASETARYLSLSRISPRGSPNWIQSPASEYFSVEQARELVERVLCKFVEQLRIDSFSG